MKSYVKVALLGLLAMILFASCEKPEKESVLDLNMELVYVEGGEFEMGATAEQGDDAEDEERPVRTVRLDSYYIGKYEVTQAQWKAVMGTTLKEQSNKAGSNEIKVVFGHDVNGEGDNYPMYYVSWEEAQTFCQKLSEKTGKKYVLPTEAQWEYAARGGNKSQHYKYAGSNDIDEVAWYWNNSFGYNGEHPDFGTHPVGRKKSNELGIYDMSGNVFEWCSDWYGIYDEKDTVNPQGPAGGTDRVFRGGIWYDIYSSCRLSFRGDAPSDSRDPGIGFRVVMLP